MDGNSNSVAISATNPRHRKLRSIVWNYFTKERRADGAMVATCNHCKKQLTASNRSGTSHLKNHLSTCTNSSIHRPDYPDRRKRRKLVVWQPLQVSYEKKNAGTSNLNNTFDQELSRQDLARMVIMHEYPLTMVHHAGFRTFIRNLQPQFKLISHETIKDDCMKIYDNLRLKLSEVLDKVPGCVSLTADILRSGATEEEEYLCFTCHYIDNDWKLQKKILNLLHFDVTPTGEEISKAIVEKMYEWKLTQKVSTIILDNCEHSEEVTEEMLKFLRPKASLLLNDGLFHVHGYAHVLDLVVQDGLEVVSEVTDRVRDAIKYVKSAPESLRRFQKLARLVQAPHKSLLLDVKGNWKSTYLMLATSCAFELAFGSLAKDDGEFSHLLTQKDFDDIKSICECLDVIYNACEKFSSTRMPTANLYFNDACGIRLSLKSSSVNPLPIIAMMASQMLYKFEEYWKVTGTLMAIASILDPRFKMKSIEYFFKLTYDGEFEAQTKIENIRKNLLSLYNEYLVRSAYTSNNQDLLCYDRGSSGGTNTARASGRGFKTSSRITLLDTRRGLDQYLQESSSSQAVKSDLDMYLEAPVHPSKEGLADEFNVLAWWRFNEVKYPILSLVARDILAIPVSVPSNVESRTINQYLSSMDPVTVQGLVCAQDWLRDEVAAANVDGEASIIPASGNELAAAPQ